MEILKKSDLLLYYRDDCLFCLRVIDFLEKEGIDIPMVNTVESKQAELDLYQMADRYTVPCLSIQGQPMHESVQIMDWLKQNKGGIVEQ